MYGCPNCKGTGGIYELNSVLVEYHITSFNDDGEPQNYGDSKVIWESAEVVTQPRFETYRCADCDHEFSKPEKRK